MRSRLGLPKNNRRAGGLVFSYVEAPDLVSLPPTQTTAAANWLDPPKAEAAGWLRVTHAVSTRLRLPPLITFTTPLGPDRVASCMRFAPPSSAGDHSSSRERGSRLTSD